jgi:hypothetical protein
MFATTNFKSVFSFIFCISHFANLVLCDVYRTTSTDGYEILLKTLNHHSLIKIAKCNFTEEGLNRTEITCERLAKLKTDKWYYNNIFLRTEFTFTVLEEDGIDTKSDNFRYETNEDTEERKLPTDTDYYYDNILKTARELTDEVDAANLSQDEKQENHEGVTYNVGIYNKTLHNETNIKNMPKFVTLKKLKLQKIESGNSWNNATISQLKNYFMFFLFMELERFLWDMDFHSKSAVGILELDEDCFDKTG